MDFSVAGKRVFAATGGRPFAVDQPAVVFLNGAGLDHTLWALPTRFFANTGRRLLALAPPGAGRRPLPAPCPRRNLPPTPTDCSPPPPAGIDIVLPSLAGGSKLSDLKE